MRIDHVIYATQDLDAAAGRVESELGLAATPGGRHEGHGTHNMIVPLGGGYLELMAVADPNEASGSPIGGALQARLADQGDGLFAWAMEIEDVDRVADRLGLPVTTIARKGLTARQVGVAEALPIRCSRSSSSATRASSIPVERATRAAHLGGRRRRPRGARAPSR